MTVKILKSGNKNQATCDDCGSILGFEPQDVSLRVERPQGPYEYDSTERYTIECPVSHTTIDVTSKISPAIGSRIMQMEQSRQHDDWDY